MYDCHVHFIPESVMEWLKEHSQEIEMQWLKDQERGTIQVSVSGKWPFVLKPTFVDETRFLFEQKQMGVEHSLISPVPQLFLYDLPLEITMEMAEVYNSSLSELVHRYPKRLSALATVPLQDPESAAETLESAMNKGLRGAIIGPGVGKTLLSDSIFFPFWEVADRLEAIIFLHPLLSQDARLSRPRMPNLLGVPWETTVAAGDLLMSGLLNRFSKVKILLAHGGGYLPYQIGRLMKGYEQWPSAFKNLNKSPYDYLKRFWFDTVVWDKRVLDFLVTLVGRDQVVSGSDYPFDLCAWPPDIVGLEGAKKLLDIHPD